jgi:hypothetical protein
MIVYEGIQRRYNIYCNLINKEPLSFPNWEYMSFINRIASDYKKENSYDCIIDHEDFDNYIIENGSKYI